MQLLRIGVRQRDPHPAVAAHVRGDRVRGRIGIALALIDTSAGLAEGDEVEIDIRGRRSPARVVKPPFVQTSVR